MTCPEPIEVRVAGERESETFCGCGKCPPVDPGDPGLCPGPVPRPMEPTLDLLEHDGDWWGWLDRAFGAIWHQVKRWFPIIAGFYAVVMTVVGAPIQIVALMFAMIPPSLFLTYEYRKPIPISYEGICPRCNQRTVLKRYDIYFCDSLGCTWGLDDLTEFEPAFRPRASAPEWSSLRTKRAIAPGAAINPGAPYGLMQQFGTEQRAKE